MKLLITCVVIGLAVSVQAQSAGNAKRFDAAMAKTLESYVAGLMARAGVPGASIAIVQDGRIVYKKGFGVRERGQAARVTPETLMMIGSTGKSMTTMMMATLVDQGKIRWDTRAKELYPDFSVSDPKLTTTITLRNLVCNCTGMQRHDLEASLANRPKTAEDVIHSLRRFEFAGTFGKTFGYVNQLVATGGYIPAWSARDGRSGLYNNYLTQIQRRVFDPIGMTHTTFSFERVESTADHATPHGLEASGEYVPVSMDLERMLEPFAPAGASWSNSLDTARYLITELNRGIAPDGRRVVSAENLQQTWKPQVDVQPGTQYGLGWMIGNYSGHRLLAHGGGTSGFTSELSFMPDDGLGITILSNAQNASLFVAGVRSRILELLLGLPANSKYSDGLEESSRHLRERTAGAQQTDEITPPYLGSYKNPSLGEVRVTIDNGKLILGVPDFDSELRRLDKDTYVIWDPPMAGALIRFSKNGSGTPALILDADDPDIAGQYTFEHLN